MSSETQNNLIRLPVPADASAGAPLYAVARHAVGATGFAATDLPELLRLQTRVVALEFASRMETLGALADADMILAAHAGEIA